MLHNKGALNSVQLYIHPVPATEATPVLFGTHLVIVTVYLVYTPPLNCTYITAISYKSACASA